MITIHGIPSKDSTNWWPFVGHWCQAALDRSGALLHLEDLQDGVANQDMQMWAIFNDGNLTAVTITEIVNYKRGKILSAFIIGGEGMAVWLAQLDAVLTEYARHMGCKYVTGEGRKGWEKVLKPLGWNAPSVTYMKEV